MDSVPPFPVAPRAFDGASRRVDIGASFDWLRHGWAIFVANPGVWIACALLVLIAMIGLAAVPLVGHLAAHLLLPVLVAGLLHLCRRQSEGGDGQVGDLLIGFRQNTGNLIMVGVAYTLAVFGIGVLAALVIGGGVAGGAMTGPPVGFGVLFGGFLLAGLLVAILSAPVIMAVWFAPALVFFNAMAPLDAMKASFFACLKNWLPFLIYGVILSVLFFFAALPLGLGFLVLIPVLSGALYASYRDIFVVV